MFGSPTMVKSLQWDDSYMMFTIPICETTFVYQRYPGLQSHPLVCSWFVVAAHSMTWKISASFSEAVSPIRCSYVS